MDGSPQVEWVLLRDQRFTDPFFDDTIQQVMRHPFHHAFRRRTGMEALAGRYRESPGLAPRGFVFHMSRCGSTLVSRVLAAAQRNIALSEPGPIDSILRAHIRNPALTADWRAEGFRWMLSALGQKRHSTEEHVFVKFDCWNIAELPVVRLAYPDVPWIFLYRDPLEVLVSQLRQRALWNLPGGLPPAVLGFQPADLEEIPLDEYCARLLGRICEIALDCFRNRPGGILVNYSQLPEFCFSDMLRQFKLDVPPDDLGRMRQAAEFNSKSPGLTFEPDTESKQKAATDRMRELANRWIQPAYAQLEAARLNSIVRR